MQPNFHPIARTGLARAALASAAALLLAAGAQAQPAPAPRGPAPQLVQTAPMEQATVSGTVQRWLVNPNGEADGLLLQDGTQIAFPPHLSAELTSWLRVGDAVQATGWNRRDIGVLRAVSLQSQGRVVQDTPPVPGQRPLPPPQEALTALQADGRVARVLFNSRGDAHGLLLEDGTVVRFPPHMGSAVMPLLKTGATVSVRGWGTRNALGTGIEAAQLGASPSTLQDMLAPPGGPGGPGAPGLPGAPIGPVGPRP